MAALLGALGILGYGASSYFNKPEPNSATHTRSIASREMAQERAYLALQHRDFVNSIQLGAHGLHPGLSRLADSRIGTQQMPVRAGQRAGGDIHEQEAARVNDSAPAVHCTPYGVDSTVLPVWSNTLSRARIL